MRLGDPVDNVGLFLVGEDLAAPGKERLACFRNITVDSNFCLNLRMSLIVKSALAKRISSALVVILGFSL
jgi:hypothetical protein